MCKNSLCNNFFLSKNLCLYVFKIFFLVHSNQHLDWNLSFINGNFYLAETFQMVFPLSSFTKSDPSFITVTATGRP